nr:hypothetical protein [Kibdelosporangium sp. MJ126-NF4]CTQ91117.1 hypothetical protein [Kibdelosporangium sp. MJ126-NF4]
MLTQASANRRPTTVGSPTMLGCGAAAAVERNPLAEAVPTGD